MSIWRQLTRGLRTLTNRAAADRDVDDELRHYLDEAAAAHRARGLPPDQAIAAARREVGSVARAAEEVRGYGWENLIFAFLADLRYAGRRLRANPGFAIVAVLTLALGIGASTAIFSAVNPILFEPLPYPRADRIVMLWDFGVDGARLDVTFGTHRELVERSRSFEAFAVMRPWHPTMTGAAEPERFDGQRVSEGYFRALGVSPALGRGFQPDDDRARGPNVAMLSDGLWRRRFGADPAVVGGPVTLDDNTFTVIGVMPPTFENVLSPAAEIWAPLQYDQALPPDGREWGHHLRMVGRLRPGISVRDAKRELDAIAAAPVPAFRRVAWASLPRGFRVDRLQDDVTRGVRPALMAVFGAVLLVLVVACVNVTHLLLARGAQRRGEFAMRAALGAGRARIVRQLLTESLLLAVVGGVCGLAVAMLGVRAFVALSPPGLPRAQAIGINGTVFAFGLAVSTVIGLIVGLVPALHAARADLNAGLQHSSTRAAGGHQVTRRTLVIAEVALALVLLVSAGLLLRSLQRVFAVDPGFAPSRLLTMQVQMSGRQFRDPRAVNRFLAAALDAVRAVPGVASAAFTSQLPLSGDFEKYGVQWESIPATNANEDQSALRYAVSPGYFETLGIPLERGRLLDARDTGDAPPAAVINESFARRKFPGGDPIGQRAHIGPTDRSWFTIVGVVGNVKHMSLAVGDADAAYTTNEQWYFPDNPMWMAVRARGDAAALVSAVRRAIWSVDANQPIVRVATMDDLLAASTAERRFALILFEAFALAALALAAIGIYGVLAGSVTERTREIGVRSALGASRGDILTLVVREAMTLTGFGIAIGVAGAAVASRALITLLFGISPLDPATYAGVVALLFGVAVVACWAPAWRASRIDPASTLRAE